MGQGYSAGDHGSQVLPETAPTYWKAGSTAQVGWALSAQHGGGYSYRLCPKSQFGSDPQAIERCFQSNHLSFANSNSTIHFDDDSHADITIAAKIYTPTGTQFEPQFTQFTQGYLTEFAGQSGGNKFTVMDA